MQMRMTELVKNYRKLAEVIGEKKYWPPKVNVALAKNMMHLEKEMQIYEESRSRIVEKYAHKDTSGEIEIKGDEYVFETTEDKKNFLEDMKELGDTEVELSLQQLTYAQLCEIEEKYTQPNAADLTLLGFMLQEE